jgi:hypothetical protein
MDRNRDRRSRGYLAAALATMALALAGPGAAQAALPPQGLYEGCAPGSDELDCAERMETISSAGFRSVLNYSSWYGSPEQVRALADQAAASGVQLIWPLNHPAWRDDGDLIDTYSKLAAGCPGCEDNDDFRAYAIGLVKDHPATWGFYVGDEQLPTSENVAAIGGLASQVRQLAPGKPTLFVTLPREGVQGSLGPFLPAADYAGTDYYPIGLEPDLSRFADVASQNLQVTRAGGNRTVMVLQSFAWSQYGRDPSARFPTRSEMQQMRDLAITHGQPDMVLWYSFHDLMESSDPAGNWESLRAAAFAPHIQVDLPRRCAGRKRRVAVRVKANMRVRQVLVAVNGRVVKRTARASTRVPMKRVKRGRHRLRVVAVDSSGKRSVAVQRFRRC